MKTYIFNIFFLVLIVQSAHSEIYWEDDFNGFTSGWTPSRQVTSALYPWTTNESFNPNIPASASNNGGGIGITNYEPSIYPANQRTNNNSWNGWVENPSSTGTITIQPNGGINNSPVLRVRLVKYPGLSSETGIQKWLGNTKYQDVYVQYKIRFGVTGSDWWWCGRWSGGNPVGPGNDDGFIIWKLGRVWTGFNPTDYDKTRGQSQPVVDTVWSRESNWRAGIWIPSLLASGWNLDKNSIFFALSNFHWEPSCPSGVGGTCDSQNNPRSSDIYRDWMRFSDNPVPRTSYGIVNNFANSGNPLNPTTGAFTEPQTFHTIEMRFKNRSNPGVQDGAYQMWIDGVEITQDTIHRTKPIQASMSSNPNDYGINFIRFVDNFNTLTQYIPDNPGYMDVYLDDIIISSSYIGTKYEIGAPPAPPQGVGK